MPTQTFPRPALFRDYSAKTKAWIKAVNPDDPTARAVDQALALIAFNHLSPESFEISDSGAAETDSGLDPQRLQVRRSFAGRSPRLLEPHPDHLNM